MRDQRDITTDDRTRRPRPFPMLTSRSFRHNDSPPAETVAPRRIKSMWPIFRRKKGSTTLAGDSNGIPVPEAVPVFVEPNGSPSYGMQSPPLTATTLLSGDDDDQASRRYPHQHAIALPVSLETSSHAPLESLFKFESRVDGDSLEAVIVQAANEMWENYLTSKKSPGTVYTTSWLPPSISNVLDQDPNVDIRVKDAIYNMANEAWVKHLLKTSA